ncbi:MAG: ACT domain-containing protein, partial [Coprobacillus cateniformis]
SKMLKKNNNAIKNQKRSNLSSLGISVNGVDGLKVQLSKCCNPIPGDPIIGYVSKGQGIKVHRADCPNLNGAEKGRLIDVYWDYTNITEKRFEVDIELVGLDRPNLLNDIITVLGQVKVNILNINAGIHDMDANIQLRLSVENAEVLQLTIDNLNKIQGIYEIKRVIH